ncbi:hypothetical protein GOV09_05115 [Candidatus Woesearchaeota archaeon]|nr:hypothetical protein [Candidatus Woesearchaeota archaeon]
MQCLAFVDTHGNKNYLEVLRNKIKLDNPDFVICAGDFTQFETNMKKYLEDFSKLHEKVFLIHGNHESASSIKKMIKDLPSIEFIHNKVVEYKDAVLIGWGGGGFSQVEEEFEKWIKSKKEKIKSYKEKGKKIILVVHAPFYNTKLDAINGDHEGNISYSNFVKEKLVDYGFCGHFHENAGKKDTIGECKVFNPGPKGKVIDL